MTYLSAANLFSTVARLFPDLEVMGIDSIDAYSRPVGWGPMNFARNALPDFSFTFTFNRLVETSFRVVDYTSLSDNRAGQLPIEAHAVGLRRFIACLGTTAPNLLSLNITKAQRPSYHSKKDGVEPFSWVMYLHPNDIAHPKLQRLNLSGIILTTHEGLKMALPALVKLKIDVFVLDDDAINNGRRPQGGFPIGSSQGTTIALAETVREEMKAQVAKDAAVLEAIKGVDFDEVRVTTKKRERMHGMPIMAFEFAKFGFMPLEDTVAPLEALGGAFGFGMW